MNSSRSARMLVGDRLRGLAAQAAQHAREMAAAVLFAPAVQLIVDAVGIEHHQIAWLGLEVHLFVFAIVQQSGGHAFTLGLMISPAADHGRRGAGVGHDESPHARAPRPGPAA